MIPAHTDVSEKISNKRSPSHSSALIRSRAAGISICVTAAIVAFHVAYASTTAAPAAIVVFLAALSGLAHSTRHRPAFYSGFAIGFGIYAPQLVFFWNLFGPTAIALWAVLAFWLGLFVLLASEAVACFERRRSIAILLIPAIWSGIEYFRCEGYYLKFSWLTAGGAFAGTNLMEQIGMVGTYGIGFLLALLTAAIWSTPWHVRFPSFIAIVAALALYVRPVAQPDSASQRSVAIAGIQLEFPPELDLPRHLDAVLRASPDAELIVLSEYTLDGGVPDALRDWCMQHRRHLIVGGRKTAGETFYNTAFVINPDGEIVFEQGKSVPIQFFDDGLPAPTQEVWNSPWGKLGICICYDLSYRTVVDRLAANGAEAIIVPTMDVAEWGEAQHQLHARVAPVRAAELRLPIFRLASSGISQCVEPNGFTTAQAGFPGQEEIIAAVLPLRGSSAPPWDSKAAPVCLAITGLWILVHLSSRLKRTRGVAA